MSANTEYQKNAKISHIPLSNSSVTSNPYELLKIMNKVIADQNQQLEEYELAFESLKKEKLILLDEKKKLENLVQQLANKIEMMKGLKNKQDLLSFNITTFKVNITTQQNQQKNVFCSPTNKKLDYTSVRIMDQAKSGVFDIREIAHTNNLNHTKRLAQQASGSTEQQYIPQPIRLAANTKTEPTLLSIINNTTIENFNKNQFKYAQNLMQAFVIIGPQISQLKKKRITEKGKQQLNVKPASLYCYGKYYKENKAQFISQIAKRAFPQGCRLRKKMFQQNQQLLDIIQYKPNRILSDDYFVFTLKGDDSLYNSTIQNPALKKSFLYITNPNYYLFVVCLKLPDFIYIRDEKNYHKKQSQIWVGEKIYAMVTYYPFFNIHTQALYRIHSIMSKILIRKILIENQNILVWNMTKTVYDIQKNPQINETLSYFISKKPDYNNQVCNKSQYYFGTLPQFGFKSQYAMSLYCCPIFFSNFAYQQMLLMLTAILCEKTLVFISKTQAMATLSALFLINLINPFQYSQQILLNCDADRVKQMIFQFPFPIICSIKKTDDNLEEIMHLFAESNVLRVNENDAQYIIVDVDSNTILYHHSLEKMFSECIAQPDKKVRQAYLSINSCQSKSFSLPKQLARQNLRQNHPKQRSQLQRRQQQMKKNVKEFMQKISNNQTKMATYRHNEKHEQLLQMLKEYVQHFTINKEDDYEILNRLESMGKNMRMDVLKNYMLQKNKGIIKPALLIKFLNSQMFANYFDVLLTQ